MACEAFETTLKTRSQRTAAPLYVWLTNSLGGPCVRADDQFHVYSSINELRKERGGPARVRAVSYDGLAKMFVWYEVDGSHPRPDIRFGRLGEVLKGVNAGALENLEGAVARVRKLYIAADRDMNPVMQDGEVDWRTSAGWLKERYKSIDVWRIVPWPSGGRGEYELERVHTGAEE